ncbi:MAG: thrombospondin type 3 repeat-containing protein [Armatimonadetes bacterium]|nr:thrombospondin type 3 repeat-containing protein [Armatimonadota bacterium]
MAPPVTLTPGGTFLDCDADAVFDQVDNCPTVSNPSQADAEPDGVGNACDNCPNWPNAAQGLPPWPVPMTDPDCDGFNTTVETFLGTLPLVQCAADTTTNNEAPDPWPPDFDDDRDVDIFDVLKMKPFFGSPGANPYSARHDLQGQDGDVDIFDVLAIKPFFGKSCT